jgi:hypothetical protein
MSGLRAGIVALVAGGLLVSQAPAAPAETWIDSAPSTAWVDDVRAATAQYRDLAVAKADGYAKFKDADGIACIDSEEGGMGVHFVNGDLVGDDEVLARHPEALVYQPLGDGHKRLVALEYIVFRKAWRASHPTGRPSLRGRQLHLVPAGNRYGLPPFFELHLWAFKDNPLGMFYEWNPRVTCP